MLSFLSSRSRLLSRGCLCRRPLSRLLKGEQSRPRERDLDRCLFLLLLSRCSQEELPGLPERDLEFLRSRPHELHLRPLSRSLVFLRFALSWLLAWSLEDLRPLALARRLLEGSSAAGDTEWEALSLEPERVLERDRRCSLALFFLAFFLPRELEREREREREREGSRSSTIRWVAACGASRLGGLLGSTTVTQVTVRSSELKKVL